MFPHARLINLYVSLFSVFRIFLSFSLLRTIPSVLDCRSFGYTSINGIRFLSMSWIVLGHVWWMGIISKPDIDQVFIGMFSLLYIGSYSSYYTFIYIGCSKNYYQIGITSSGYSNKNVNSS